MLGLTMNKAGDTEMMSMMHFNPQTEHKNFQVRDSDVTEGIKTATPEAGRRVEQVGQTFGPSGLYSLHRLYKYATNVRYLFLST